jgi:EAL domain-containing protein (putative c-di-GMP-specific phosphodiesterase class I)
MFRKIEYYRTLEMGHVPMAIISPVLDEQERITDFRIEYVNNYVVNIISKRICVGQKLSEVVTKKYPKTGKFLRKLRNLPKNQGCTLPFYSPDSETKFLVTLNKTNNNFYILTFTSSAQKADEPFNKKVIKQKLSRAKIGNDFELYFQPQYYIQKGNIRGFEALIRWYDDELGFISPEYFIKIAEETNLIIRLGWWVMETAVAMLKIWQIKYSFKGILSVNVSVLQLREVEFLPNFFALLKNYNINPKSLEIEITESVLIDDMEQIEHILKSVRDADVLIALDDFGMGYSSLKYLQRLPFNTLKIDKSIIDNITFDDNVSAPITSTVIELAQKLGLETIAEGVESFEQLEMLKSMNCGVVQGFLRGKPMNRESCEELLQNF